VGEDIPQAIWLEMPVIRITKTDTNELVVAYTTVQKCFKTFVLFVQQ